MITKSNILILQNLIFISGVVTLNSRLRAPIGRCKILSHVVVRMFQKKNEKTLEK